MWPRDLILGVLTNTQAMVEELWVTLFIHFTNILSISYMPGDGLQRAYKKEEEIIRVRFQSVSI